MSLLPASLLTQTLDDHISWMAAWTRAVCFAPVGILSAPESFASWYGEAEKSLHDQALLTHLATLHDQMHKTARLVALKAAEGTEISVNDYDSVATKYQEFVVGLRRWECALATAAAGLDPLTGLRSRLGMIDELTRELKRYERGGKGFCVALMDIDHFKKINDAYGHENGDRVLTAAADHISRSMRAFDDVWRWGGEEFLICLKEVDLDAGRVVIERLREGLERTRIKLSDGVAVGVTASFGMIAAEKALSAEAMLEKADKALYSAKAAGRNRVEVG